MKLATLLTVALGGLSVSASPRRVGNPFCERTQFCISKSLIGRSRRSGISAQEGKRRCNRLVPAKRRVAGIGGVIPRPVESLPRAPVPAVPLPWAPGRLCPRLNEYGTADSKQNSFAEFAATISHSKR